MGSTGAASTARSSARGGYRRRLEARPAVALSRSLKDVLHIMERIAQAGAGFRSLTENIDTTTPAGRIMMQMVGSFAEFERAMIRERTSAGLAAARAEGRVGGRRRKLDPANAAKSPRASSQAASPGPKWPGFTTSAHRQCHALLPSTVLIRRSLRFSTEHPVAS